METSGRSAQNAATPGAKSTKNASQSQSTGKASDGIAGIADGTARTFTRQAISVAAVAWVQKRRISRPTLERLGVASGTAFFPDLKRKAEALFFPYEGGWKARALSEKAFVSNKGFKLSFWNIERVLKATPDRVFIAEGELDALALVEAGISADAVLSVPNGAREKRAEDPQEVAGYDYVLQALRDGLRYAKKFIWCGDGDAAGLALRSDMARLFGAARFYFVNWPEGCKDANDLLINEGHGALRNLVEDGALPWPVDGIYRLSELPEPAPLELESWFPGMGKQDHAGGANAFSRYGESWPRQNRTMGANMVQHRSHLLRADVCCVV
jgi:twinkle protein